jgi:hypothetical protein
MALGTYSIHDVEQSDVLSTKHDSDAPNIIDKMMLKILFS